MSTPRRELRPWVFLVHTLTPKQIPFATWARVRNSGRQPICRHLVRGLVSRIVFEPFGNLALEPITQNFRVLSSNNVVDRMRYPYSPSQPIITMARRDG